MRFILILNIKKKGKYKTKGKKERQNISHQTTKNKKEHKKVFDKHISGKMISGKIKIWKKKF